VYAVPGGHLYAVDGVSFEIGPGEAVALVGESGSGKSTIGRCVTHLEPVSSGRIEFLGRETTRLGDGAFRPLRREIQIVFQDPRLSLNPRLTVRQTLAEPLLLHRIVTSRQLDAALAELLDMVSLDRRLLNRRPRALSGGQQQRVAIARAIATRPKLVVLDEPTASVDMSVRQQLIELLARLQAELNMSYLFITHDLSTARSLCSRTVVLYLGRVVEQGRTSDIFASPKHPYTKALISSVPIPDPTARKERLILPGETPSPVRRVVGCPLIARCPYRMESCHQEPLPFVSIGTGGQHSVACVLYGPEAQSAPWDALAAPA
jgi:peptide/nickel transport system ATP-binding protein/oligopeptide transport system ATP-binding protein